MREKCKQSRIYKVVYIISFTLYFIDTLLYFIESEETMERMRWNCRERVRGKYRDFTIAGEIFDEDISAILSPTFCCDTVYDFYFSPLTSHATNFRAVSSIVRVTLQKTRLHPRYKHPESSRSYFFALQGALLLERKLNPSLDKGHDLELFFFFF